MTNSLDISQDVKNFYNVVKFPGEYTKQQLEEYDSINNNLYLQFINKHLSQKQSIVDIGCGSGLVTNVLAMHHRDCSFTALDFSNSLAIGKTYANNNSLKNTKWIQADFIAHNFQMQFDVVICQGVLHHMPDYKIALEKLKTLVKPGGVLLLGVYNPLGKFLKKFFKISYHSNTLYQDQEHNPFETSFRANTIINMCSPFEFIEATPGGNNKYACDVLSFFNSRNGGLTLYAFRNNHA
jgi:2-polyprenyl-3-methyl-5-hydroxy-6-metoxy-1,4-benzoquinol methylase